MDYSQKMIALPFEEEIRIMENSRRIESIIYLASELCKYKSKFDDFKKIIMNLTSEKEKVDNVDMIVDILKNSNIDPKFIMNDKIKESLRQDKEKVLYTTKSPIEMNNRELDWIYPQNK